MRILGIESSSLVASVAIVTDGVLTGEYTMNHKKTHSQTLLPMMDQLVQMVEIELDTVDGVAVSGGPFPYCESAPLLQKAWGWPLKSL